MPVEIPVMVATKDALKDYGQFITPNVAKARQGILMNFDDSNIQNTQFNGEPIFRIAPILYDTTKGKDTHQQIAWLERHFCLTQGFIGLGNVPYIMILGKPTHSNNNDTDHDVPNISDLVAFVMPPGTGIFLHIGTWHDFPIAIPNYDASVVIINSQQIVDGHLDSENDIMQNYDIYRIKVEKRLKTKLVFNMSKAIQLGNHTMITNKKKGKL